MTSKSKDRKRTGNGNLLPPIARGEVRNPKGVNQWTALRATAEKLFTAEAQKRLREGDPATTTQLEAWLSSVWERAIAGKAPHLDKLIAERLLPIPKVVELTATFEREVPQIPTDAGRMAAVRDVLIEVGALDLEQEPAQT